MTPTQHADARHWSGEPQDERHRLIEWTVTLEMENKRLQALLEARPVVAATEALAEGVVWQAPAHVAAAESMAFVPDVPAESMDTGTDRLAHEAMAVTLPVMAFREGKPKIAAQKFGVVLADPPWRFQNWSMEEKAKRGEKWARRNGRSPYDTLDTEEIANLKVSEIAAKDSVCLLWATNPKLEDALLVMKAWGFTYKTKLTWAKMTRAAAPRIGLGYRARACTEDLLLGTRGNPPLPPPDQRPEGLMFCPIGSHSAKPDYQYDIAEAYEGPWVELFHRPRNGMFPPRDQWTFLGNECPGNLDIRDALAQLIAAPPPPAEPKGAPCATDH